MRDAVSVPAVRRIALLLLLSVMTFAQGCSQSGLGDKDMKPAKASLRVCCTNMEEYPRWYVDMARTIAPALGTVLSHVAWRSGYLKSKRSAQDAIKAIQGHLKDGKSEVYDADLSGYFDSIPHDKLIACLRMRIVDGSVLRLIRQWLKAPVVEPADKGAGRKVTRNDKGTPQGGVISPLLANLYLHS